MPVLMHHISLLHCIADENLRGSRCLKMSVKPDESLIRAGISTDSERIKGFFNVAAYVALGAFTLSPLLFVSVPPLVDYPDHLARMWILVYGSENYVANWHLLPTLAMDLVVPPLAQIMPVEAAGKLFIALTMALLVIAKVVLHRVLHGRVGLWPLCSLLHGRPQVKSGHATADPRDDCRCRHNAALALRQLGG
jgi:hypothetical protein